MKKKRNYWLLAAIVGVLVIVFGVLYLISFFSVSTPEVPDELAFLELPQGYAIDIFAENLGTSRIAAPGPGKGPRMIEEHDGAFFVSVPSRGEIVVLHDPDHDGVLDDQNVFMGGLDRPHGIAFADEWVYIAEESMVFRVKDADGDFIAEFSTREDLVELPSDGGHWTRSLVIMDDSLFISTGSSCNVCDEEDKRRAAITRCALDGSSCEPYASGLRNAVGMEVIGGELWVTENSRDLLGNDIPPDELNVVEEGANYGWPYCYGKQIHDTDFDENVYIRDPCEDTVPSRVDLQAHSAPLGLAAYEDDILVAYHGSWNRNPPTGYKVVRVDPETNEVTDFVSGWLGEEGAVFGRPVDILVFDDAVYVTDDATGRVYRIYKVLQ